MTASHGDKHAALDGPIGFVGLGNMGLPMSRNLAEAGFPVVAYDAQPQSAAAAAHAHQLITVADGLADIAASCRVVVLMLPDSHVVNRVMRGQCDDGFGRDGLAAHLGTGAIVIDMSSSFPPETVKLGQALSEHGIAFVDAPVSGGVKKAVSAELAIMTGGQADIVDHIAPMLGAMGHVFRTGDLGSGHATKALNNFLSASSLIATAEALVIGQKFGLDPHLMNAVFNASTGRSNTTEAKVAQYFIPETYASGFTLGLLDKDVDMARQMAAEMGCEPDVLTKISDLLSRAHANLGGATDHTAMHAFVKKTSG